MQVDDSDLAFITYVRGSVSFESVQDQITQFVSNKGVANSMTAKLNAAKEAKARGNENAKKGHLKALENELKAQSSKSITPEHANQLIIYAYPSKEAHRCRRAL